MIYVLVTVPLNVAVNVGWQRRSGSGGGAVSVGMAWPLIAVALGFALGVVWQLRRSSG